MPNPMPLTLRAYRLFTQVAQPLLPMTLRRRAQRGKEDLTRLDERRGITTVPRPSGALLWIHGASVGEVLAAAALIEELRGLGIRILLTSGTTTSAAIIAKRFPPDIIHQYLPFDSPRYVERFLDQWRPSLALFIESDIWPNLVLAARARRLPLILVNARMSPRSYPRWRRMPQTIGTLMSGFEACLAQTTGDAERFASLGCGNVVVTGNLKLDVPAPPADEAKLHALATAIAGRPIVVAASTHPGEDSIILEAHHALRNFFPTLLTIIVPRHPARGDDILTIADGTGARASLRSRHELPNDGIEVYIADTMGELGLFYRLSPVVVMGGSFVPHGGQNPIEPIKLGAAVVHGPHVFNFGEIYDALDRAGGAQQVTKTDALVRQLGQLIANAAVRDAAVEAGLRVVEQLGGALGRTLFALEPYLLQLRLERVEDA